MIRVERIADQSYRVTVEEGGSRSRHTVTLQDEYYQKLSAGKVTPEELIHRSFEFLLAREPKESILSSFDLPVIQRYFPEYESAIGTG
ncbi:MAG: hypothetical protein JXB06_03645 [Spirochaetales bacterium]|nr:hypothetical protein [Spirochaetales bacterium]